MVRHCTVGAAGLAAALLALPASAIAPGTDQIGACGRFTASKYKVPGNQLTVNITRRTTAGYYLNWTVKPYNASGSCFVTMDSRTTRWVVERGPRPEAVVLPPRDEQEFPGLPGYGDVVVQRGQVAIGEKQYFWVRPNRTGQNLRWYARCANNSDQVYDHDGNYVGYDRRLSVMFPYVCAISPLKPQPQPR